MAQEDPIAYQCQLPKPCLQFPAQGFKQEHQDPQYERAGQAGSRQQYPAVLVKQEQVDFLHDSGRQNWLFLHDPGTRGVSSSLVSLMPEL